MQVNGIWMLANWAIKGKPVRFRCGPAAVIGDECRTKPLSGRKTEVGNRKSDGRDESRQP